MINLTVSANGAIFPNRGINVGKKFDNTNEVINFTIPEELASYNMYVAYENSQGTFLVPLTSPTWTFHNNITNYPGTIRCLLLFSASVIDPTNFVIDNTASYFRVSGEFRINIADHFLTDDVVEEPEPADYEVQIAFNNILSLYNWFNEAKENDYYRGPQGNSGAMTVGTVVAVAPSEDATVVNTGTAENAVLNFSVPRGIEGHTPVKGIDYNTIEDGKYLLQSQNLGRRLIYTVNNTVTNNGIFHTIDAAKIAFAAIANETAANVGLYSHIYLNGNFGISTTPLTVISLEGFTFYNSYTWAAVSYLGYAAALQIGSRANPIRELYHVSADTFNNVTTIKIKLSRPTYAIATYDLYIGDNAIVTGADVPLTRDEYITYTFTEKSGTFKFYLHNTTEGAIYLQEIIILGSKALNTDIERWYWGQVDYDSTTHKETFLITKDFNNNIYTPIVGSTGNFSTINVQNDITANALVAPTIYVQRIWTDTDEIEIGGSVLFTDSAYIGAERNNLTKVIKASDLIGAPTEISINIASLINNNNDYFDKITGIGTQLDPYIFSPKTTLNHSKNIYIITGISSPVSNTYCRFRSSSNNKCLVKINLPSTTNPNGYLLNFQDLYGFTRFRITSAGVISMVDISTTVATGNIITDINSSDVYNSHTL